MDELVRDAAVLFHCAISKLTRCRVGLDPGAQWTLYNVCWRAASPLVVIHLLTMQSNRDVS